MIRCSTENLRSQRAAERQGFRRDGVIRANEIIAGRAHDHAIYTLLRSEWQRCARLSGPGRMPGA